MQLGQKQHELALRNHEAVLQISGTYDKAIIKQSFTDLAVENPELYNYARVFYWSMVNYFAPYRSLSTGLISGNTDSVATQKEKLIKKLKSLPKDFSWQELTKLLTCSGFVEINNSKTGGSGRKFIQQSSRVIINLHKPDPSSNLKLYALKQLYDKLTEEGLI